MGSVQRMATVVIVGLVALSTVLFLYLGRRRQPHQAEEHGTAGDRHRARPRDVHLALLVMPWSRG